MVWDDEPRDNVTAADTAYEPEYACMHDTLQLTRAPMICKVTDAMTDADVHCMNVHACMCIRACVHVVHTMCNVGAGMLYRCDDVWLVCGSLRCASEMHGGITSP